MITPEERLARIEQRLIRIEALLMDTTHRAQPVPAPRPPADPFIRLVGLVCQQHNVHPLQLRNRSRARAFAWPRMIICYVAANTLGTSAAALASYFSRDLSSIHYAIRTVRDWIESGQLDIKSTEIAAACFTAFDREKLNPLQSA
jgi:hypothetical protein